MMVPPYSPIETQSHVCLREEYHTTALWVNVRICVCVFCAGSTRVAAGSCVPMTCPFGLVLVHMCGVFALSTASRCSAWYDSSEV